MVDTHIMGDFRVALLNNTDVLHHLVCSLPVTAVAYRDSLDLIHAEVRARRGAEGAPLGAPEGPR